jgi:hypothetical protein
VESESSAASAGADDDCVVGIRHSGLDARVRGVGLPVGVSDKLEELCPR